MQNTDDLKAKFADLIPVAAKRAYRDGDERLAATWLHRARNLHLPGTAEWAILERLEGLLWIAVQREVEGTFALDRADRVLDALGLDAEPGLEFEWPGLDWLE